MRRYVSANRSAVGVTTATVSLVDGELSSKYSVKTYTGDLDNAIITAEKHARLNLQALKDGLEVLD